MVTRRQKTCTAHMKALESFEFVYCIITLQRSLSYLKDAIVKIQWKDKDIVSGVSTIMESCVDLKKLRENVDAYSQRIFDHSSRLAKISNISISKSRISCRQQHHQIQNMVQLQTTSRKPL